MARRFLPQDTSFFDLFGAIADLSVAAATELSNLIPASTLERAAIKDRVAEIEHEADEATHALIRRVNSSFITPFDHTDIHALGSALDTCIDEMDDACSLIVAYRLDRLPNEVTEVVSVLVRMAELTAKAMPRLRSMRDLTDYWVEVNRLENQADQLHIKLLGDLFNDDNANPLQVMKLKDVIEQLEAAADAFEAVAHKVESIAVKES